MVGNSEKRVKRRVVSSGNKNMTDGKHRGWVPSKAILFAVTALSAAILVQGSQQLGTRDPDDSLGLLGQLLQDPQNFKGQPTSSGSLDSAASSLVSKAAGLAGSYSPTASTTASGIGAKVAATSSPAPTSSLSSSSAASNKASSVAKASSSSSGTSAAANRVNAAPTSWTWVAGAFGCPEGVSAYGTAFLCSDQETATAPSATSSAAAKSAKNAVRIAREDHVFADMGSRNFLQARQTPDSGNGGPPTDVNNLDSPDLGWLDTVVGGVPYKNGDLAASIVWILAVLFLIPLFLIRLLRRSSLIAHVLFTIFIWGCAMVAAMGIRAYLSNNTPTTTLMIVENILLQILPPLLLEPLLNLLAMYARQGNARSGVPTVCLLLRFFNLVALILFAVTAAYTGVYLHQWDETLMDANAVGAMSDFPDRTPLGIVRIGPIVGAFLMIISIAGGLLL